MRLLFAALALGAPLFAQCSYSVSPLGTLPAYATSGKLTVTTGDGCAWSIANPLSWFHLSASSGTGTGDVAFSTDANHSAQQRTGTISVTNQSVTVASVTVTQAGAPCAYAIYPQSGTVGVGGGKGSFQVTTGCLWQAVTGSSSFITVQPTGVQLGNATVNYTAAPNACVSPRTGSITISTTSTGVAPVFSISQDGSPANMTLSPASANAGPNASDGRVTVTTGTGCTWTASSDVTWLQITGGASGSGNGAVSYHLLANSTATRTGSIHVGNLTFTVTQAASGPTAPTISAIGSAANYRTDAVSPGEIVSVFGTNMGPLQAVPLELSGGYVTSFLAGTQVLFDGVPAPILFTFNTQVNVVVPYGVDGKSSTQVTVVYNGVTSQAFPMAVQTAHPAIFTMDKSGLGPGAILNQDFTLNSATNGAARGSVVAIYATGGGTTTPLPADGAVTGADLPRLTQPVSVTIGGIDASVTYSGGAPSAVAGLTQINATVPEGVTPGIAVPVVVRVGNYSSSAGVTLAVR